MLFTYQSTNKLLKILQIKWDIIEAEGKFPDYLQTFFKCGIVLFKRTQYEKGNHSNDIAEAEIEYAKYNDERLLDNFNKIYKLITLKYGHLL